MAEPQPGTVFYSRVEVMTAKLHKHSQRGVDFVRVPELHAHAIISGDGKNKDMGGLLTTGGLDFLIYFTGGVDVQPLAGSQTLGMQIRLIRKVKGANPFQAKRPLQMQYVYLYCGLYEVVAGWQINEQQLCSHFKLIRVPGQVPLTPQQMFFKYNNSKEAESFRKTWKAYEQILQKDCSKPCEQINPFEGTGINAVL